MLVARAVVLFLVCGVGFNAPPSAWAEAPAASSFYEDGVVRHRRGDLTGAVVQLKNALQQDPALLPARTLLGTVYLELGQGAAAEYELARAERLGADRSLIAEPMARALLMQGKYQALLEQIDPEGFPRSLKAELLVLRGHAQVELGKFADAERTFALAARTDPDAAGALVGQAMVLLRRGHPAQALEWVDKALALEPGSADAWNIKASVEHALGRAGAALEAYSEVLKRDPRDVDARIARAGLQLDLGEENAAAGDIEYLKTEYPGDPRAYYLDSLLLHRDGKLEQAQQALQQAAAVIARIGDQEVQRRAPVLLLAGLIHYSLGEHEQAIEFLTRYVHRFPGQPGARKLLGASLLARGDHFRAIDALEPAVRAAPDDYQAMELLGLAYMRRGWHVQAAELLDRAAQMNVATPGIRIDAALNRLAKGDHGAVAELERLYEQHQDQTAAGLIASATYLRQGEPQQALRIAETLVRREPDNPTFLNLLASAQVGTGALPAARTTLERILSIQPDFTPAQLNLARLERMRGRRAESRQRLAALLAAEPRNASAMLEMAALAAEGQSAQESLRWLEKAHAAAPDHVPASVALIDRYIAEDRVADALAVAKNASARAPESLEVALALARSALAAGDPAQARAVLNSRAYLAGFDAHWLYRIAMLQRAAGAPLEAVYTLQKAAKGAPDAVPVQRALAETLMQVQRWQEAAAVAANLKAASPESAVAYRLEGDIQFRQRRFDDALRSYQAALERQPSSDLAVRIYNAQSALGRIDQGIAFLEQWQDRAATDAVVRQALAEAYTRTGRTEAAIEQYERLLRDKPDQVTVLNNLAYLLAERDRGRALTLAQRAIGMAPEDASVNDTLGWLLVRDGRAREALPYLREAQFRDAADPDVRYHLAVALHALGRTEEARAELQIALASGRALSDPAAARALMSRLEAR